jgi:hypothetical protein
MGSRRADAAPDNYVTSEARTQNFFTYHTRFQDAMLASPKGA